MTTDWFKLACDITGQSHAPNLAPGEDLTPAEEITFLNELDAMEECECCGEPHDDLIEVEGLMRCANCRGKHRVRWGRL